MWILYLYHTSREKFPSAIRAPEIFPRLSSPYAVNVTFVPASKLPEKRNGMFSATIIANGLLSRHRIYGYKGFVAPLNCAVGTFWQAQLFYADTVELVPACMTAPIRAIFQATRALLKKKKSFRLFNTISLLNKLSLKTWTLVLIVINYLFNIWDLQLFTPFFHKYFNTLGQNGVRYFRMGSFRNF